MVNAPLTRARRARRGDGSSALRTASPIGAMRTEAMPAGRGPSIAGTRGAALVAPDQAMHVLHRLTFGPRSSDLQKMSKLGVQGWIAKQLAYENIDDSACDAAVAQMYPDIALPIGDILRLSDTDEERFWYHPYFLKKATIYRALQSKRPLYEVMVEFWSNHFNIYHEGDWTRWLKTPDDRKVIRKHAMGRFRDLLHASAKSPAMLYFLDNFLNPVDGFNENYGRELMELHTISIDGGYTQADVVSVARCFTGWTFDWDTASPTAGKFRFEPWAHDSAPKTVLGHAITTASGPSGIIEGQQVLDILASHPSTARFISMKLCRRFIGDTPPTSAVNAAAATFTSTDGDIRAVLRTIFSSPEFLASADQKFKRPFEWLISALRALEATVTDEGLDALLWWLLEPLGQMPFDWAPPNGYPDVAGAWMNTNGLMYRWNAASAIAFGWIPGVTVNLAAMVDALPARTIGAMVDAFAARFLHRGLSPADRQVFADYAAEGGTTSATVKRKYLLERAPCLVALLLSSPHFQWR